MRQGFALAAVVLGFVCASTPWSGQAASAGGPEKKHIKLDEVDSLIQQLREPKNKVRHSGGRIPGGETLEFSEPMRALIALGARARPRLHQLISDAAIQKEVVLILGAIGDKTTVPLLIEAYPKEDARGLPAGDARVMKVICFTFALTYLTCQPIGRSRMGADFNPKNGQRWRTWWRQNSVIFVVPAEKPNFTWVPSYPVP